MPGTDGLTTIRQLISDGTEARIIILTTFESDEYVLTVVEAGVAGFLLKNTPPDTLIDAIQTVYRGDSVISPGPTRRLSPPCAAASQPVHLTKPSPSHSSYSATTPPTYRLPLLRPRRPEQTLSRSLVHSQPAVRKEADRGVQHNDQRLNDLSQTTARNERSRHRLKTAKPAIRSLIGNLPSSLRRTKGQRPAARL